MIPCGWSLSLKTMFSMYFVSVYAQIIFYHTDMPPFIYALIHWWIDIWVVSTF
jgi:hypothetical protein